MPIPFQNSYAKLPDTFYIKVDPTPVRAPKIIALNTELAHQLGIDPAELNVAVLSGNRIPAGAEPLAMAYSGHQFGGFSPQLGDGRAILLGEVAGKDIQLKGSGPTPFSRRGDGRSALGPVLREYLVSEAMAALGVPTTRALAAVLSGENVLREEIEPGGIFTRVASSHLRIGTVQYFAARRDRESLEALVDYTLARHYPESKTALDLLENVITRQASLIAHWMSLGFIHGVMNTDNMSLSGETIDYGPCAFMDRFDPAKKFSFIDQQGRYAYHNQASIARWNLTRLAEALLPLIHENEDKAIEIAKESLMKFGPLFEEAYQQKFSAKLGLTDGCDPSLIESLLTLMAEQQADFTLVFRHLSGPDERLFAEFRDPDPVKAWLSQWRASGEIDIELMKRSNPVFIPRNHRVEEVIEAGKQGNFEPFHKLHAILQKPFTEQPQAAEFERSPEPDEIVCNTFCGT
ncbi:YdiU family protein [Haloferula chungangensis]|uniref:Protein nucleotidyltransferase YdiU n=1 Tax=Haloferula chungangensis TaxID=1048331 RepID=A0ABW2L5L3_9BACT